jgi:hypothetical protein
MVILVLKFVPESLLVCYPQRQGCAVIHNDCNESDSRDPYTLDGLTRVNMLFLWINRLPIDPFSMCLLNITSLTC